MSRGGASVRQFLSDPAPSAAGAVTEDYDDAAPDEDDSSPNEDEQPPSKTSKSNGRHWRRIRENQIAQGNGRNSIGGRRGVTVRITPMVNFLLFAKTVLS